MIIKSAWAKNYGVISDQKQEFIFNEGINLVVGINGGGKSTIPKLMKLCLFNECDDTLANEINWYANSFDIGLIFEHQQTQYKISIEYDGKVTNRTLLIDNHIEYKGENAISYLKEKFNPSIFQAAIFAMQNEIDIIKMKPAEKRLGLQKVFDLEFKEEIKELENDIKNKTDKDLNEVEKELYRLEHLEYDIKQVKDLPYTVDIHNTNKLKLESVIASLTLIQSNLSQYNKLNDQIILKSSDVIKLRQQKDLLNIEILKIEKDIDTLTDSNNSINVDQAIKTEIDIINIEITKLNNQVSLYQKNYDDIKLIRIPAWTKQVEIDKLNDDLVDLKSTINDNKKNGVAWSQGKCGECGTTFNHTKDEIDNLRKELKQQLEQQQSIDSQIKNLQLEKSNYDQSVKDNDQNKQSKELLKKDIESTTDKIKNQNDLIETTKKNIRASCEQTKQKNNEVIDSKKDILKSKKESVQEKEQNIVDLQTELNNLKEDQLSLNIDEQQKNKLEQEKTDYQNKVDSYLLSFSENELIVKNNKELEEKKVADELLLNDVKIKRDTIMSDLNDLNKSLIILKKELPANILSDLILDIQNGMNKFIDKIYYKSLDVRIKEIKDGIHINYGYKGKGISKKSSGFEQQLLTLAYKDALNKKAEIGLLILDEMDNNATEDNAIKLYEMFGSMREIYNQIIVISHNEMAKNLLRNNFQASVIEMSGGKIV